MPEDQNQQTPPPPPPPPPPDRVTITSVVMEVRSGTLDREIKIQQTPSGTQE
jgi:hypothetical protein